MGCGLRDGNARNHQSGGKAWRRRRRHIAGERQHNRPAVQDGGTDALGERLHRLMGVHAACGVQRGRLEELLRVDRLDDVKVESARHDIAGDRDDRATFTLRVEQSVDQVRNAGSGGPADRNGFPGEEPFGARREGTPFLVANVDVFNVLVVEQRLHGRVQCVTDNPVAALNAGICQHLPQIVCNCSRHIRSNL